MRLETQSAKRIDRLFVALADGSRRAMIDRLSTGPALGVRPGATTQDRIAISAEAPRGAWKPAVSCVPRNPVGFRTYQIAPDAFSGLEAWVAKRKAIWNRQFDALDRYLKENDA